MGVDIDWKSPNTIAIIVCGSAVVAVGIYVWKRQQQTVTVTPVAEYPVFDKATDESLDASTRDIADLQDKLAALEADRAKAESELQERLAAQTAGSAAERAEYQARLASQGALFEQQYAAQIAALRAQIAALQQQQTDAPKIPEPSDPGPPRSPQPTPDRSKPVPVPAPEPVPAPLTVIVSGSPDDAPPSSNVEAVKAWAAAWRDSGKGSMANSVWRSVASAITGTSSKTTLRTWRATYLRDADQTSVNRMRLTHGLRPLSAEQLQQLRAEFDAQIAKRGGRDDASWEFISQLFSEWHFPFRQVESQVRRGA